MVWQVWSPAHRLYFGKTQCSKRRAAFCLKMSSFAAGGSLQFIRTNAFSLSNCRNWDSVHWKEVFVWDWLIFYTTMHIAQWGPHGQIKVDVWNPLCPKALWVRSSCSQTSKDHSDGISEQEFPIGHRSVCTCSVCSTCRCHTARAAFTKSEHPGVKPAQRTQRNFLSVDLDVFLLQHVTLDI